jgi:hypothetical protein
MEHEVDLELQHEKLGKSIAQRTETTKIEDENALEDSFESLNVSFEQIKTNVLEHQFTG